MSRLVAPGLRIPSLQGIGDAEGKVAAHGIEATSVGETTGVVEPLSVVASEAPRQSLGMRTRAPQGQITASIQEHATFAMHSFGGTQHMQPVRSSTGVPTGRSSQFSAWEVDALPSNTNSLASSPGSQTRWPVTAPSLVIPTLASKDFVDGWHSRPGTGATSPVDASLHDHRVPQVPLIQSTFHEPGTRDSIVASRHSSECHKARQSTRASLVETVSLNSYNVTGVSPSGSFRGDFNSRGTSQIVELPAELGADRSQSSTMASTKSTGPAGGNAPVENREVVDISLHALQQGGSSSSTFIQRSSGQALQRAQLIADVREDLDHASSVAEQEMPSVRVQVDLTVDDITDVNLEPPKARPPPSPRENRRATWPTLEISAATSTPHSQPKPLMVDTGIGPDDDPQAKVVSSTHVSAVVSSTPASAVAVATKNAMAPGGDAGEGLLKALSSFGQPNEWWHDSIILGRLSALAMRFFISKALRRPWDAWQLLLRTRHGKHLAERRCRTLIALRSWRWRTLIFSKHLRRKLPLMHVLSKLPLVVLRPTWARLQQAVFLRRDLSRRLKLLYLVERRMLDTLALAHYYQSLLRLGLAGFWLATQVPPFASPKAQHIDAGTSSTSVARGHVQQVVHRVWRRWCFATQMWLSSAEYRERETEAWLAGECTTPRSIVTHIGFRSFSAGSFGSQDMMMSSSLLSGLEDNALVPGAQIFEPDLPDVPFPEYSEDGPLELSAHAPSISEVSNRSRGKQMNLPPRHNMSHARHVPHVPRRQVHPKEAPLSEPPQRTKQWTGFRPDAAVGARKSPSTTMVRSSSLRKDLGQSDPDRHFMQPDAPSECDDDSTLIDNDGHDGWLNSSASIAQSDGPVYNPPDDAFDTTSDYWAIRCRLGPSCAARPVVLRQRC